MKQKAIGQQFVVAVVVLLATCLMGWYLLSHQQQVRRVAKTQQAVTVETAVLTQQAHQPVLAIYGYVMVPKAIEISSKLAGDVEVMSVKPGDRVKAGQVLLRIDASEYRRILAESEAEYAALEAQIKGEKQVSEINQQALDQEKVLLALSEKRLKRQRHLANNGVVTTMVLENSQREAEQHRLQVTQRESLLAEHASNLEILAAKRQAMAVQVERARDDLQDTQVLSPTSGIVADVNIAEGSRVEAKELVRIIPDGAYEVRGQIPSKYADTVRHALAQDAELPAVLRLDQHNIDLVLDRLLPVVADGQMGQQAVFSFKHQSDSEMFAHKMPVYVRMQLPAVEQSYQVSTSALFPEDTIYVVDANKQLRAVAVRKMGYAYDAQDRSMVIVTADEPLDTQEVLVTHIPNPTTGLVIEKAQAPY